MASGRSMSWAAASVFLPAATQLCTRGAQCTLAIPWGVRGAHTSIARWSRSRGDQPTKEKENRKQTSIELDKNLSSEYMMPIVAATLNKELDKLRTVYTSTLVSTFNPAVLEKLTIGSNRVLLQDLANVTTDSADYRIECHNLQDTKIRKMVYDALVKSPYSLFPRLDQNIIIVPPPRNMTAFREVVLKQAKEALELLRANIKYLQNEMIQAIKVSSESTADKTKFIANLNSMCNETIELATKMYEKKADELGLSSTNKKKK